MEQFTVTEIDGVRVLEGAAGVPILARGRDAVRLLEACFDTRARAVLLHAENLPPAFFDLSSGEAGEVLQKLRTYGGYRLAVVAPAQTVRPSHRFGEMAAEERWKGYFGVFESVADARAWLTHDDAGSNHDTR